MLDFREPQVVLRSTCGVHGIERKAETANVLELTGVTSALSDARTCQNTFGLDQ
jgi:ribonuclease HI